MENKIKLNICHIINCFEAGGAQTFLVSLTEAQKQISKKNFIISLDEIENTQFNNFLIENLKSQGINVFSFNRKPGKNLSILKSIFNARAFFKKNDFDIINTHLPLTHFFTSLLFQKIKIVNTIHNAPEKTNFITRFLNKSNPKIYCSQSAKDLNKFLGLSKVINNGIKFNKPQDFSKINIYDELKIPFESKIVISVGAVRPQKNYTFLLELIKNHFEGSDVHFIVCGGSDPDSQFHDEISNSNLNNFHFIGVKSNITDYFNSCDLFLSCSLFEGLPIAVLEAFYSGIPAVLSPIEQHKNISNNMPMCEMPESFNSDSFMKKIQLMLNLDSSHQLISKKRRHLLEKYDTRKTAESYSEFYTRLFKLN